MNKTSKEKEAVLNVFAALMRPLTRVAFEYGITAGEIAGTMRRVYIEALEARLKDQHRPTTDARLAAIAGLPRSDVSALREAVREGAPLGSGQYNFDQIAVVLSVWNTHKDFLGAYGIPVELDLEKTEGSPRRTFPELLSIASPGVDSETMLEGLLAIKAVEVVDDRTVRCLERAFVHKGSDDVTPLIERAGRFLGVVAGSFSYNLLRAGADPFYFERVVVSDEVLTDSSRDAFLAVSAEKGQALMGELDSFLSRLPPTEPNASGKKYGLGIYFFEEPATNGPVARSVTTRADNTINETQAHLEEIDVLAPRRRKE